MKKEKDIIGETNEPRVIIETDENSPFYGLNEAQVQERILKGEVNEYEGVKTKSEKEIIFGNVFTFFNIINFFLAFLTNLCHFLRITF